MKNLHFFRETSRGFVGALCAFSILFPTIPNVLTYTHLTLNNKAPLWVLTCTDDRLLLGIHSN